MFHHFLVMLLATLSLLGWHSAVAADGKRFALVIGNSQYGDKPLLNPRNDAEDMAARLAELGYTLHDGGPRFDLDRLSMEQEIKGFAESLPKDAQALVFYAGHGMTTRDDNYLIPVNHSLEFQEQLPDRAVSLRSIVELLKTENPDGVNVVLLDACRDNPLVRNFRSADKGLQRLNDIPRGTFIGYAADNGQVAEDGRGRNGTYTEALLAAMTEMPDTIVELAHKSVARSVFEKTNGKQFPVSENKVYGNWCFGSCVTTAMNLRLSPSPIPEVSSEERPVVATTNAVDEPPPSSGLLTNRRTWLIVGGVVLALLVAAAAADGDADHTPTNFELTIAPPR